MCALCDHFSELEPIFEWYMARLIVKKGHQNVSHNEIKLCAQNVVTILGSIVSTIGRAHTIIKR